MLRPLSRVPSIALARLANRQSPGGGLKLQASSPRFAAKARTAPSPIRQRAATAASPIAFASMDLSASLPRQEAIIPRKTVLELSKLLADTDEEVRVELSGSQAAFGFGSIDLVSKLIDGKFPDYTRVIPTNHKNKLQADRELLRQALQRAAILSNEKFRGVRWVLADGSLKIVSSNADQEEAQEELEVSYAGDSLDIGFNVNYLLDVLNNVPGTELECAFGDSSSSALISYGSEKGFKYVVMPMRI